MIVSILPFVPEYLVEFPFSLKIVLVTKRDHYLLCKKLP